MGREVEKRGRKGKRELGSRLSLKGRWEGTESAPLSWILFKQSAESLLFPHMGNTESSINR